MLKPLYPLSLSLGVKSKGVIVIGFPDKIQALQLNMNFTLKTSIFKIIYVLCNIWDTHILEIPVVYLTFNFTWNLVSLLSLAILHQKVLRDLDPQSLLSHLPLSSFCSATEAFSPLTNELRIF